MAALTTLSKVIRHVTPRCAHFGGSRSLAFGKGCGRRVNKVQAESGLGNRGFATPKSGICKPEIGGSAGPTARITAAAGRWP